MGLKWVVSPTGFEPVLLAPEASALSRLSYGTQRTTIIKRPPQAGQEFATDLSKFVTAVTPLIDGAAYAGRRAGRSGASCPFWRWDYCGGSWTPGFFSSAPPPGFPAPERPGR